MSLKYLLVFLLFIQCGCFPYTYIGLSPTENSQTENGKKHGTWKNYLGDNFYSCEPGKARYYEYVFFDNGVWAAGGLGGKAAICKDAIKMTGEETDTLSTDTIPEALNGTYICYDKEKRIKYKYVYNQGMIEYVTNYYPDGSMQATWDYTNRYNNIPFTAYVIVYRKDGSIQIKGYDRQSKPGLWAIFGE